MQDLRQLFQLRDDIVFLNHGSFGACPIPVFEAYQEWQRELERQPVEFLGRRFGELMYNARKKLAAFLHTQPDNIVYIPNATTGINIVASSLPLEHGDEVLTTDHEYGACDRTWEIICQRTGAVYKKQRISLPIVSREEVIEKIWSGVTARTKVLFISHITSPTAIIFPVEKLIIRARERGIITVVDGAHVPGQLRLNLDTLGADFYTGNCHKWMMTPKGSAFLYARPEKQVLLRPYLISWNNMSKGERLPEFIKDNEFQGTSDIAPYLAVAAGIEFFEKHNWPEVRKACRKLVVQFREQITELTGLPPLTPPGEEWFCQLAAFQLPPCNVDELKIRLYDSYAIEIPVHEHFGLPLIRISIQGYNTGADVLALTGALSEIFS